MLLLLKMYNVRPFLFSSYKKSNVDVNVKIKNMICILPRLWGLDEEWMHIKVFTSTRFDIHPKEEEEECFGPQYFHSYYSFVTNQLHILL